MALDLNVLLRVRASALAAIRCTLDAAGGIEVTTPIACTFPDLAPVPQMQTRHPESGTVFCLRIAPEEHLTRLIARGAPAVYEVSTNFRVEEVDKTHLIEFQSVEAIFADTTIEATRTLAESLCRAVDSAVAGQTGEVPRLAETPTFPVIHLPEWIATHLGFDASDLFDAHACKRILKALGVQTSVDMPLEDMADMIIQTIAARYDQPVFISSPPRYLGGPANESPVHAGFLDRSELYWRGLELGSLANQLAHYGQLRERYALNARLRAERRIEPNLINDPCLADYALGLPPYCGLGLGVDRLLMLALDIDDVRTLHPFIYD